MTGNPWMDALLYVAMVVGAVGAVWRPVKRGGLKVFRMVRRIGQFLDDWEGRPDLGQPSMPQRVEEIEYQLRPDGGKTLRDRMDVVEALLREG